jgi:Transaldolase
MNNIDFFSLHNPSIWIDYISKEIIESGELNSLINKGITGLTSNPSIFEKAISNSDSYDEDIKFLAKNNPSISSYEVFELLSITDFKNAATLLLETYDSTL